MIEGRKKFIFASIYLTVNVALLISSFSKARLLEERIALNYSFLSLRLQAEKQDMPLPFRCKMYLKDGWLIYPKQVWLQVLISYFILNSLSKPSYRVVKKARFLSGCYLSPIILFNFSMCAKCFETLNVIQCTLSHLTCLFHFLQNLRWG